ncbi:OmpA/MotB domain-containing protein [Blattabacterium sp. (Blatta orientalis) str. Tarazona]|uniref:OmpA family protein n=1 Tax=Blattabacterium sp. (Blatta orientalis) TaxID=367806 RepID=UPI0002AD8276|nr:OmpA family protein [Blattabacterium sp. (Blatta orientalis)]AGD98281.1 OmpA/MotB domain-containing protein [Blattabacterium sp. (Blatta orientalis) str. Tarazona]
MKNVNFFIIALFALFSSGFSQHSQKKWFIRIGANDINYYPINSPFKDFFQKKNNSINPLFSNIEFGYNITKNIGGGVNASLGMVDNNRWKIIDNFFVKFSPGIKFYFFPHNWLDPYLKLGAGYHYFDYQNRKLRKSGLKIYQLDKKNFFLLDGGLGMNFWIVSNFGVNVQSNYNQVIFSSKSKDYLNFWEHSIGVVYRFGGEYNPYPDKNESKKIVEIKEKENSYLPSLIEKKEEKNIEENSENKICCKKEDLDNDGILDREDLCPNKFGLKKFKGCPDTDSDNIPDHEDVCPKKYGKKENKGCPNGVFFPPILFDLGKFSLSPNSLAIIDEIYEIMIKKLPNSKFYINGYTDSYGKHSYNKILSIKRANSVFEALVYKGIDPSRMEIRKLEKSVKRNKGRLVEITIRRS